MISKLKRRYHRSARYRNVRFLILLAGLFFVGESFALPPCPEPGYRDNCFGVYTTDNGDKYVAEFKDDKRDGPWAGYHDSSTMTSLFVTSYG